MLINPKSLCEIKITSNFTGLSPSVHVIQDNVQDETTGEAANCLNLLQPHDLGL